MMSNRMCRIIDSDGKVYLWYAHRITNLFRDYDIVAIIWL